MSETRVIHNSGPTRVAIDGGYVLSGGADGSLALTPTARWGVSTTASVWSIPADKLHTAPITALALHAASGYALSASADGMVGLHMNVTDANPKSRRLCKLSAEPRGLSIFDNGQYALILSDSVRVLTLSTNLLRVLAIGVRPPLLSASVSPDNRWAAVLAASGDVAVAELLRPESAPDAAAASGGATATQGTLAAAPKAIVINGALPMELRKYDRCEPRLSWAWNSKLEPGTVALPPADGDDAAAAAAGPAAAATRELLLCVPYTQGFRVYALRCPAGGTERLTSLGLCPLPATGIVTPTSSAGAPLMVLRVNTFPVSKRKMMAVVVVHDCANGQAESIANSPDRVMTLRVNRKDAASGNVVLSASEGATLTSSVAVSDVALDAATGTVAFATVAGAVALHKKFFAAQRDAAAATTAAAKGAGADEDDAWLASGSDEGDDEAGKGRPRAATDDDKEGDASEHDKKKNASKQHKSRRHHKDELHEDAAAAVAELDKYGTVVADGDRARAARESNRLTHGSQEKVARWLAEDSRLRATETAENRTEREQRKKKKQRADDSEEEDEDFIDPDADDVDFSDDDDESDDSRTRKKKHGGSRFIDDEAEDGSEESTESGDSQLRRVELDRAEADRLLAHVGRRMRDRTESRSASATPQKKSRRKYYDDADEEMEYSEEAEDVEEDADAATRGGAAGGVGAYAAPAAWTPSFQVGATGAAVTAAADDDVLNDATGDAAGSGSPPAEPRYLALNAIGAIRYSPPELPVVVFHDKGRGSTRLTRRGKPLAAALGPNGAATVMLVDAGDAAAAGDGAAAAAGAGGESSTRAGLELCYRAFQGFGSQPDWVAPLDPQRDGATLCITVGKRYVALFTEKYLRLFSIAGWEIAVIALPHRAICATGINTTRCAIANDPNVDPLMYVFQETPGGPLAMRVLNVEAKTETTAAIPLPMVCSHPALAELEAVARRRMDAARDAESRRAAQSAMRELSDFADATLQWIGFSDDGELCCASASGRVLQLNNDWGRSWMPVLEQPPAVSWGPEAPRCWVWHVTDDKAWVYRGTAAAPHPRVAAELPVPEFVDLVVPVLGAATRASKTTLLRQHWLRLNTKLNDKKGRAEVYTEELARADTRMDAVLLMLFEQEVKEDRSTRAVDLASSFQLLTTLERAAKMAHEAQHVYVRDKLMQLIQLRVKTRRPRLCTLPALGTTVTTKDRDRLLRQLLAKEKQQEREGAAAGASGGAQGAIAPRAAPRSVAAEVAAAAGVAGGDRPTSLTLAPPPANRDDSPVRPPVAVANAATPTAARTPSATDRAVPATSFVTASAENRGGGILGGGVSPGRTGSRRPLILESQAPPAPPLMRTLAGSPEAQHSTYASTASTFPSTGTTVSAAAKSAPAPRGNFFKQVGGGAATSTAVGAAPTPAAAPRTAFTGRTPAAVTTPAPASSTSPLATTTAATANATAAAGAPYTRPAGGSTSPLADADGAAVSSPVPAAVPTPAVVPAPRAVSPPRGVLPEDQRKSAPATPQGTKRRDATLPSSPPAATSSAASATTPSRGLGGVAGLLAAAAAAGAVTADPFAAAIGGASTDVFTFAPQAAPHAAAVSARTPPPTMRPLQHPTTAVATASYHPSEVAVAQTGASRLRELAGAAAGMGAESEAGAAASTSDGVRATLRRRMRDEDDEEDDGAPPLAMSTMAAFMRPASSQ